MIERFPLDAPTRALSGETNAYVVGGTGGLLIDPGGRSSELDSAVRARVGHVAVTHHHPDHAGAVAEYAREYDLTVWALSGRAGAFEDAAGISPDRTFTPGESLPVGGDVTVLDTPGHAPEHVAFRVADGLVTGDLVVAEGSVVVGAPEGDMRAYLSSLRRVHTRNPAQLYPGHGRTVEDPQSTCERLVRHRLDRERRVLGAVRDGNETLDEIVPAAYEKDVSGVYELARATVLAHVEKLAVEGKVSRDDDRILPA